MFLQFGYFKKSIKFFLVCDHYLLFFFGAVHFVVYRVIDLVVSQIYLLAIVTFC